MRISEAIASSKPLEVKFEGGGVLHIEYRPPAFTIAEMEEAGKDKDNPKRLISLLQGLITAWDLETNAGEPIDLADAEAIRVNVTGNIIMEIVRAVREDNAPGEA